MNSISIFSTTITSPSAPIHTINFSDPSDKVRYDRMLALVSTMLELTIKLRDAKMEHVRSRSVLSRHAPVTLSHGIRIGIAAGKKDKLSVMKFENRYLREKPYPI